MTDIVERLEIVAANSPVVATAMTCREAVAEIERLRTALHALTSDITASAAAMDAVSLSVFEDACQALEPKP